MKLNITGALTLAIAAISLSMQPTASEAQALQAKGAVLAHGASQRYWPILKRVMQKRRYMVPSSHGRASYQINVRTYTVTHRKTGRQERISLFSLYAGRAHRYTCRGFVRHSGMAPLSDVSAERMMDSLMGTLPDVQEAPAPTDPTNESIPEDTTPPITDSPTDPVVLEPEPVTEPMPLIPEEPQAPVPPPPPAPVRLAIRDAVGRRGEVVTLAVFAAERTGGRPAAGLPLRFEIHWPTQNGPIRSSVDVVTNAQGYAFLPYQIPLNPAADYIYLSVNGAPYVTGASRRVRVGPH